jgi:cyclophilin family peptidyl-prolyl cis-trans isomerase
MAPAVYNVRFDVTTLEGGSNGEFVIEVHEDWAPLGAARFKEMVDSAFFRDIAFFRVIDGFMAQCGIAGEPGQAAMWLAATLVQRLCF